MKALDIYNNNPACLLLIEKKRTILPAGRRGNGFWKIQIQLDFFLLEFVGLDYFGCGCPHAKLNWMSNQYWMFKH
jgi:hypothetical protein